MSNSNNTFTPSTITIYLGDTVNFAITSYYNAQEVGQRTWKDNANTPLSGSFETPFAGGMFRLKSLVWAHTTLYANHMYRSSHFYCHFRKPVSTENFGISKSGI